MRYILITNYGCSKCVVTKKILERENIKFKEHIIAEEGMDLATQYGVMEVPKILDTKLDKIVNLEEVLNEE